MATRGGRRGLEMIQEQHDVEAQLCGKTGLIDHLRNRPRARKAQAEPDRISFMRILLRIQLRHNVIGLSVRLDQIVRAMQLDGSADLEACRMEQVP